MPGKNVTAQSTVGQHCDDMIAQDISLQAFQYQLEIHPSPLAIADLVELCTVLNVGAHLAILTKPYLDKIVAGDKYIESRFTKNRIPPFRSVQPSDFVLLKETCGPIRAIALISKVEFFGPLCGTEAVAIMATYKQGLALEDAFIHAKQQSMYATLMHLVQVVSIQPVHLDKSDRRSWISLSNARQYRLF